MDPQLQQLIAQAQALRAQLRQQGLQPGEADKAVQRAFPGLDINLVREKKHGGLRGAIGGIGDVLGKAAPLAALIPGVGWAGAAALGGLGGLAGQLNDHDGFDGVFGDVLKGGAIGGLGGLGVDGLQGSGPLGGVLGGIGGKIGGVLKGGEGGGGGLLGTVGGLAGKLGVGGQGGGGGISLKDLLGGAAGAGSIVAGAQAQGKANKLQDEAVGFARERNAQLAPLRDFATARLLAPQPTRQNLSSTFSDPTNPFAR